MMRHIMLFQTEDMQFNGVKVRLYVPEGLAPSKNPGIVFYHGGGFVLESVGKSHQYLNSYLYHYLMILI